MKKIILFVGRVDNAFWDLWLPFCEKHDLDIGIISYTKTRGEARDIISTIKNRFKSRLKFYYVDCTVVDRLEYNGWKIHTRTMQFWRLWDFYMKHPEIYSYDVLIKSRLDIPIPENLIMAKPIQKNTLYLPEYHNHPFGLKYTDQFAYGDRNIMEKYCKIWEEIPNDIEEISDNNMECLFFSKYSGESLVTTFIQKNKVKTKTCYYLGGDFSHVSKQTAYIK